MYSGIFFLLVHKLIISCKPFKLGQTLLTIYTEKTSFQSVYIYNPHATRLSVDNLISYLLISVRLQVWI